ncbi:choline dehydrogenase [Chroococcidiopsis sp. CCALA 051]|uniref:GMC family oxidoreductase n=1 Tax=Chroococcidiopsis sp. CCALA 051 TaxID=869949 RepID=UPI000D0D044E|nr:GMC family oxidoreductase N-terminal domain-containing protein [Chroococcidiopsis sp. CCALA 051]PSM47250.1 choline dehydrogenase [Chroococcidiopsis sp. CCALA 051]
MNFERTFDYIIVGAGAAGCVIAYRLMKNLGCSVLLLEAGSPDNNPAIHNTDMQSMTSLWGSNADWGYSTEPEPGLGDRQISIAQGKVLGGGTSINAMMYIRGNRRDYDRWKYLGNEGWSYQEILPYFKKSEDYEGGASEYRGVGGPLHVINYRNPAPVSQAFVSAAMELGYGGNDWDCNGAQQENGAFFYQSTRTQDDRRCSTAVAFLRPILGHPNFAVEVNAQVTRLLFAKQRVIGLEYLQDGKIHQVKAEAEVILSCGAFESPKLLMLSGIGAAEHLQAHSIPLVVDLPGVGKNLQDHLLFGVGYSCKQEQPVPNLLSEAGLFTYTSSDIDRSTNSPDLQFFFGPVQFLEPQYRVDSPGFTFAPILVQPQSRGTVSLRSNNPQDLAVLRPNYLQSEADLEVLIRGIELSRELVNTRAFDEFRGEELAPGISVTSKAELSTYIRQVASTVWHPVGTCKMGSDRDAVVNSRLQVYGVEGLRVADASIMPTITSGNTNAPTIAIGEKAADLIIATR